MYMYKKFKNIFIYLSEASSVKLVTVYKLFPIFFPYSLQVTPLIVSFCVHHIITYLSKHLN